MEILFTKKKLDKKLISEILSEDFSWDFIDVISTKTLSKKAFELKNKSLIFTSVKGVDAFFENKFCPNEDFATKNFNKIYCVGEKTKKRLRNYGFGTFKMKKNAKELSEFITKNASKEKFLHFCGNLTLNILDKKLSFQNIGYEQVVVYETHLLYPQFNKSFDAVAFFSPSGVRSFVKKNSLEDKIIFSIGNTTSKEIKKYCDQPIFTSKESNLKDVLKLISKNTKAIH